MEQKTLEGKVAVVTGAGQGIGYGVSRQLVMRGAHVILNDIEEKLGEEAAAKIQKETGGRCIPVAGDVSNVHFLNQLVEEAVRSFGQLDIAIANAGITIFGDFTEYEVDDFDSLINVNLRGTFFLAQAAARQMISQGQGGKLLFMSSVTGVQAHQSLSAHGMTQAAIQMLARNLVIELSPHKINVNALAPGATITQRTTLEPDYESTWAQRTPMGRAASIDDIANAASFLVSAQADHITGQTLIIDGGWTSISPL